MAVYKYYLNGTQYEPINTGSFTFDINLERENGAYQYVQYLNGNILFKDSAYEYILKHGECQKIELLITETCEDGIFDVFNLYFTRKDCKWNHDEKKVSIEPKHDSLYNCLKANYDTKFNFLEVPEIVSTTYKQDVSQWEFLVVYADVGFISGWGTRFGNFYDGGLGPNHSAFVRERKTTYCKGGEPQAPPTGGGDDWQLLFDNCAGGGYCVWVRKPIAFASFTDADSDVIYCIMPCPPFVNAPNWIQFWEVELFGIRYQYFYNSDVISFSNVELNNGRPLTDTINYALTKSCPELGLISDILTNETNPITGQTPSDLYGVQLHAITDVKFPDADEPATREDIRLKDILDGYISSKLNCFWWVDEKSKRLLIQHFSELSNNETIDLTDTKYAKYTKNRNQYEYDNSDNPISEEFPSQDVGIDFTGVDITYKNACAEGNKAYNTDRFYSEVEAIINDPDAFGNDGIVVITPDSCAPTNTLDTLGDRSENGVITNVYYPNAPQAMANLQDKYWKVYRPFGGGNMNFLPTQFEQKPNKKIQEITIPICCFFFFNPRAKFEGWIYENGQLENASFNPKTGFITLNIMYYE